MQGWLMVSGQKRVKGFNDRTLAEIVEKCSKICFFSLKNINYLKNIFFCIYLLVKSKYWGKQLFPGSGSKAKDGEEEKNKRRKRGEKD